MNKPHYFYKISVGSETGNRIRDFIQLCHDAAEEARLWAEKHGIDVYYESPNGMAGGICAVEFPDAIHKEGWDRIETSHGICFFPQENSDLEKSMYSLPVVSETELIPILNLKPRISEKSKKPLPFSFGTQTPLIFLHRDYWYIDVPYESGSNDCVSITSKLFYRKRMAEINLKQ